MQEDGKARCLKAVRELSQAFALAVSHRETVPHPRRPSLCQHLRAALSKRTSPSPKSDEELDHAVRQIVLSGRWSRTSRDVLQRHNPRRGRSREEYRRL